MSAFFEKICGLFCRVSHRELLDDLPELSLRPNRIRFQKGLCRFQQVRGAALGQGVALLRSFGFENRLRAVKIRVISRRLVGRSRVISPWRAV